MSHELRTPLNVILGFIEMVRDPDVKEAERRELHDRIAAAGRELLELIEGTLTVGKVEAGRDEARFEEVSLSALWRELREACERLPRSPDVRLEWSTDVAANRTFRTDPTKVKVIVRNLVGNALKFTEHGSVSAALALADDLLSIRVADTGIGIAPDDQGAIFEMFRQADGSDTRRYGGTGLGLYIVRRFTTQLGGTVSVRSTPGGGSVFEVVLPRTPPAR
jgi:signal transduction histidine kinase